MLVRGCEQVTTAIHETLHALGFSHEQRRGDRNEHLTILEENIQRR